MNLAGVSKLLPFLLNPPVDSMLQFYFRKLATKLPWILDLPSGLVCRVLQSVGILKKEKQIEIAGHLQMPRVCLYKTSVTFHMLNEEK